MSNPADERREATSEQGPPPNKPRGAPPLFGAANWTLLALGLCLLAAGYLTLACAGARAENLAGTLSPLSLLGGYLLIFLAIIILPNGAPANRRGKDQ